MYHFMSYAAVDWGGVMVSAVTIMTPDIILTMIFTQAQGLGLAPVITEKGSPCSSPRTIPLLISQLIGP
jgi:hypothetical protein